MTSSTPIPPPGEEATFPLDEGLTIRHGSSLSLMTQVCEFLANPVQEDAFNYVDPTADHQKWARKGLSLYYASVVTSDGHIVCALRAATKGMTLSERHHHKLFLIDYVYSAPSHREKGIAGQLIDNILQIAQDATLFVLSIEESCVYWMEKQGFYLCQNEALNEQLNVFPDTHLLIHKESHPDKLLDSNDNDTSSSATPPATFQAALQTLIEGHTDTHICLSTIATLIQNARNDDTKDGRRRTIRINNAHVHRRVFAVGGEAAMQLLQICGFELTVDEQGNAILRFEDYDDECPLWLDTAVAQLEAAGEVS